MATIERVPRMNRVYIIGEVEVLSDLLRDFRARHDGRGYWVPLYREADLRAAIKAEKAYQAKRAAERDGWERTKSVIPPNYKLRHGSEYGGTVRMDGEVVDEPALDTSKLPWRFVAQLESRVRDLTGESSINGRVMDSETLYDAVLPDGRMLYRMSSSHSFGDDLRETYWLPPDLWERLAKAELEMRGITRDIAREWLAKYRGCVGSELYEYAEAKQIEELA